jgi:hypothetical protein
MVSGLRRRMAAFFTARASADHIKSDRVMFFRLAARRAASNRSFGSRIGSRRFGARAAVVGLCDLDKFGNCLCRSKDAFVPAGQPKSCACPGMAEQPGSPTISKTSLHSPDERESEARLRMSWATIIHGTHSITSSARASSVDGTSRPRALAVFMLMTNSNLVGCKTGRSAGFSSLRTRPT